MRRPNPENAGWCSMSPMLLLADRATALAPPGARSVVSLSLSCAKAASVAFAAEQVANSNRESAMVAARRRMRVAGARQVRSDQTPSPNPTDVLYPWQRIADLDG